MSTPQVPPRPSRSQQSEPTTSTAQAVPTIPPRPTNSRIDRSESPRQSHFPRSPLNEPPFHPQNTDGASDLHKIASLNASRTSVDLPPRPPSVNLPTIGQEGIEYEASTPVPEELVAVDRSTDSPAGSPTHTRKVSNDLPLHAPRPSLSSSDAKQRVAAVVRTDSNHGAVPSATGAGLDMKSSIIAEKPLRSKPSFNRPSSSASHDRPGSSYEDEYGIPSIGQQVPLAHQYGDVQAPSPAPGSQPNTPGTPAFDRPGSAKHHHRSKSGRQSFQAPPGSYGLHGHGNYENVDDFEKSWLQKHPDALREEMAAHSPAVLDRHDYTLSAEQLNKIVRGSKSSGFGASKTESMPDEQIGYLASDAYTSRNQDGRPVPIDLQKVQQSASNVESPLKKPATILQDQPPEERRSVVHVNEPEHRESKHLGRGQASEQEHIDLGPRGGNTEAEGGWVNETGYGVPILASDEFDPTNEYLHPAVPPIADSRRGSRIEGGSLPNSRPSSRPGSVHNVPALLKSPSRGEHHYLEDVREYEPLFPDEPEGGKKPTSQSDRFKQRPDMKQRFPSRDIWEDAPASVNLEAEVETPEPDAPAIARPTFEPPEVEAARKGEPTEAEKAKLLSRGERLAQSSFQPRIKEETRWQVLTPQRFPSRDIWEDTPDSAYITATVGDEELPEEIDEGIKAGAVVQTSSVLTREGATAGSAIVQPASVERPDVPPRPARAKSPGEDVKAVPVVPARPARRPSPATGETLPTTEDPSFVKSKPSIPARPAKSLAYREQVARAEEAAAASAAASLDKDTISAVAAKSKPQVPARPVGGKIGALQAAFLTDLNKKIGAGPSATPPKAEPAEEKPPEEAKPLEDARKGRARGPARRKPAASPAAAVSTTPKLTSRTFFASPVMNLFDISPEIGLTSTHADGWSEKLLSLAKREESSAVDQEVPPAVGFNTQGEAVHVPSVTSEAKAATSQVEGAPVLQAEAEASTEPSDVGHAAVSSVAAVSEPTSASRHVEADPNAERQLPSIVDETPKKSAINVEVPETEPALRQEIKTGVVDPEDVGLTKTASTTQTGEMTVIIKKEGSNPIRLTGYKNGSAHEEGMAFVEWDNVQR